MQRLFKQNPAVGKAIALVAVVACIAFPVCMFEAPHHGMVCIGFENSTVITPFDGAYGAMLAPYNATTIYQCILLNCHHYFSLDRVYDLPHHGTALHDLLQYSANLDKTNQFVCPEHARIHKVMWPRCFYCRRRLRKLFISMRRFHPSFAHARLLLLLLLLCGDVERTPGPTTPSGQVMDNVNADFDTSFMSKAVPQGQHERCSNQLSSTSIEECSKTVQGLLLV